MRVVSIQVTKEQRVCSVVMIRGSRAEKYASRDWRRLLTGWVWVRCWRSGHHVQYRRVSTGAVNIREVVYRCPLKALAVTLAAPL